MWKKAGILKNLTDLAEVEFDDVIGLPIREESSFFFNPIYSHMVYNNFLQVQF